MSEWDTTTQKPIYRPTDRFSYEILTAMQQIMSQLKSGAITPENAIKSAELISPKQAAVLKWALDADKLGLILALLMTIYTIFHDVEDDHVQQKVLDIMMAQSYEQSESLIRN